MKNKLEKLEAIRGIAALYVVFHHSFFSEHFIVLGFNLSFFFKFGQEAVILFFLMSGFVIGYSFEKSRDKGFRNYFQKRFYRIYIPLFLVFLGHYILSSIEANGLVQVDIWQLVANVFMLQDVSSLKPNVIADPFLGNAPLWSLSYEWWFYMTFYLLYSLRSRHVNLNSEVFVIVAVSSVSYLVFPNFLNRLLMYYGIWWVGVAMAKSFIAHNKVVLSDLFVPFSGILIATLVLSFNAYIHAGTISSIGVSPLLELRHFAFALVAVLIALLWQSRKWRFFDMIFGKFAVFAPVSYVLYISHYFLVSHARYLSVINNKYVAFTLYLGVALGFSYLIEVVVYPRAKKIITQRIAR
ncbi:acyltransferase family protein [Pedobacter deserti]|uniref:acyltransferase family protein n=1 Tax=Pedobacter deserti TaxID=2817382 RepID=UPI002108B5DD|nr:acyltransferase [Pedobacter sp. SYSU D00382]